MARRKTEPILPTLELPGLPLHERGLEARVVLVTPKLAEEWMQLNDGNREPRSSRWATYGRDMGAGNWSLTGEPLIFDSTGTLRNGQHRLIGCITSGGSFWTVVIWGVDPVAFRDMDRGATRSIADVLGIDGEANATAMAAAAQLVFRDEHGLALRGSGGGASGSVTAAEAIDVIERHPELRESVHVKNGARKAGLVPRLAVFAHYKLARLDKQKADDFFEQLYDGANLEAGNPILTLRNQLTGERTDIKNDLAKQYAWIVTAWNHWRAGHKSKQIRWVGSKLPRPE